jgi:murein L,D-transpeptidase YcbB/YkuD
VKLSEDPRPTLGPGTFVATLNAAERYGAIIEAGGWPIVPNALTLAKPGERAPGLAALRKRLVASQDLAPEHESGDILDESVAAALRRFQFRHGLPETGLVGPRTLAQLNVPAATRLRQIQASSARLLGSRFPFGDRYVTVNIPSATVEAVQGGVVHRRYVAIVGKTDRPSPQVATRITTVNFNPTWTVPASLVRKDIIPHMRKDPGYMARIKIRMYDGAGQEVDPATIDWSTERAVNYMLRQDSGTENSLGEIRLDMPNKHAVYMHDTPSKRLFAKTSRLQSSGCVRVAGVKDLARWLLDGSPGPDGPGSHWGSAEIDAAIAVGKRADAKLAKPVPVAWVYLTGYASPDGTVHFRDDVYGLDALEPAAGPERSPTAATPPLTLDALITSSVGERR